MKFLHRHLEKAKYLFEPGGKLEKLYPLYEANDTFLFTPSSVTTGKTHIRDALDLKRVMITVVISLMPCFIFALWNVGHQYHLVNQIAEAGILQDLLIGAQYMLPIVLVSYAVGGFWEVLFSIVRKHEINEGFLVTGLLFPLVLPPTIPLWQVAVGISFGIVIGKEIFGGTGFNVLNPALTGRAFLFFAYPAQISGEVWTLLKNQSEPLSGWTGATPLGIAATASKGDTPVITGALQEAGYTFKSMFFGMEGGSMAETAFIPILLGALLMLLTGIASWRIMISGCIGLSLAGLLMNLISGDTFNSFTQLPFYYHFVMGGFLFGIVFMATDPVSAAVTNIGKWIYGFMIGFLTVIIRVTNPAYPEGVMLSILFMNVMAPLIDYYVVKIHIKKRLRHV